MHTLPANATLIANPDVWIDGQAIAQLGGVAGDPQCIRAVGMPDLHGGTSSPVGAVFAMHEPSPPLLGGDIGCGVRLTVTGAKLPSLDKLERRLRGVFDGPPRWEDPEALFDAAWCRGADLVDGRAPSSPGFDMKWLYGEQLGTIGGGNHFAEVTRVRAVHDERAAAALGMVRGSTCCLVHSGSRALGKALAARWANRAVPGADVGAWMADLTGGRNYAAANRVLITDRLLRALGASRRVLGALDLVHNDMELVVSPDGSREWVHRKGAAPAGEGELTVVLGSRGTPSYVMKGTGSAVGLCSVAHGAGRRMRRGEALAKLKSKYTRKSACRGRNSSRLIADKPEVRFEEHPDAYKAIEPVVRSLVDAGLATVVAELEPRVTVKQ